MIGFVEGLAIDGRLLWAAAAALYFADSLHRLTGPAIVVSLTGPSLGATLSSGAFGAFGTRFHVPLPLSAIRLSVYLDGPGTVPPGDAVVAATQFRTLTRGLRWLRITTVLVFVAMFAAGPLLAAWRGLWPAMIILLPLIYGLNIVQLILLYRARGTLRLTRAGFWHMVSDVLLCAPYGANLAGRLAARWRFEGDPAALALLLAPADARLRVIEPALDDPGIGAARKAELAALLAAQPPSPIHLLH